MYQFVTGLSRLRLKANEIILLEDQRSRLMEKPLKSDPVDPVLISPVLHFTFEYQLQGLVCFHERLS